MTAVLVTSMTPRLGSGAALRTYTVTAALARTGPVDVRYVVFGAQEPSPEYARLPGVTLTGVRASRGLTRATAYLRARAAGVPEQLARGVSAELRDAGRRIPDDATLIADGPVPAAALIAIARRRPAIYLAHNLESSGFRGADPRGALRRFERRLLETYAESWMATRADARGAEELAAGARTRYVPNVVDTEAIAPVKRGSTARILLVADFRYAPNREGAAYLIEQVMPLVWAEAPDAVLRLVGRGLDGVPADPRIEVAGFVEDLRDAYAGVAVVTVPLLRGGGSPLKFAEGLAHGLPVVATAHAAGLLDEGIPGRDFLAAADADAFAAAVLERLRDPEGSAAIGRAGRALAQKHYSVSALAALLADGTVPASSARE